MSDFTPVWQALSSSHVLLLVDTHPDPSKPNVGYDIDFFEEKVEEVHKWFETLIKSRAGLTDFLLINGAWLCVRPLVPAPPLPQRPNLKVMVLR